MSSQTNARTTECTEANSLRGPPERGGGVGMGKNRNRMGSVSEKCFGRGMWAVRRPAPSQGAFRKKNLKKRRVWILGRCPPETLVSFKPSSRGFSEKIQDNTQILVILQALGTWHGFQFIAYDVLRCRIRIRLQNCIADEGESYSEAENTPYFQENHFR